MVGNERSTLPLPRAVFCHFLAHFRPSTATSAVMGIIGPGVFVLVGAVLYSSPPARGRTSQLALCHWVLVVL